MDDQPLTDRRADSDRRHPNDRRQVAERRSGRDRRGSGIATGPSAEPRAYAFRSFDDRRREGDRRSNDPDRRYPADRRAFTVWPQDDVTVELTPEEILVLLHRPED